MACYTVFNKEREQKQYKTSRLLRLFSSKIQL